MEWYNFGAKLKFKFVGNWERHVFGVLHDSK